MHSRRSILLFACLLGAACGSNQGGTGSAKVVVTFQTALSASDVTAIAISITGAHIATPITAALSDTGGQWGAFISGIPVGLDTFQASASDASGNVIYAGSAIATIGVGNTTLVSIDLQETNPPPPPHIAPPVIDSLTASSTSVVPGGTLTLTATGHDPQSEAMTYAWTASAGALGTPSGNYPAAGPVATTWTAPASIGTQTITFTLTNTDGASTTESFTLDVETQPQEGAVDTLVSLNTWPVVNDLFATPSEVPVGATAAIALAAVDADGDPLTFVWSTDTAQCSGTFSDASASPNFTPAVASGSFCTIHVAVSDGRGGHTNGTFTLNIGTPVAPSYLPQINGTYQGSTAAFAGEHVLLTIAASDPGPLNAPITFAWSVANGSIDTPASTASGSQIHLWGANCTGVATATVIATNTAGGLTATRSFSLNTCPADCGALHAAHGEKTDGAYPIQPDPAAASFSAFCDMSGGGWTLIGKLGEQVDDTQNGDFTSDTSLAALQDGSAPQSTQYDHLNLGRFAAFGATYTVRTVTDTNNDGSHFQYTFWRPAPGVPCDAACAGTNWAASTAGSPGAMLLLQRSSTTGAGNATWIPSHGFDQAPPLWLFAYRDTGEIGDSTRQCLDAFEQTQECHFPSGSIASFGLTGTASSAFGDGDGVTHDWGKRATYWIKNVNAGGTP